MGKKKPKSKAKPASTVSNTVAEPSLKSELDIITAAICTANQTVFMKVCRLCESKDGPFLNIFDAEKVTAKKIDELMPFKIAENDDLPHKICFRCSAKVEELYEFIQKCINTQQHLNTALGKKEPLAMKTKTRAIWEEKLNKSNISNDDICDALIKKAMEGIKDIPVNTAILEKEKAALPAPKKDTKAKTDTSQATTKKESKNDEKSDTDNDKDVSLKQLKLSLGKCENKFIPTRASRSHHQDGLLDGLPDYKRNFKKAKQNNDSKQNLQEATSKSKKKVVKESSSEDERSSNSSSDVEFNTPAKLKEEPKKEEPKPEPKPVEPAKPFNIMDHVSTIKVNGVGVLFQCKLCNRNFLKKDVVTTHGCSKTGGIPRVDFTKNLLPPEPPKAPVVKYINTKIDGELGKPFDKKIDSAKSEIEVKKPENKSKPKIGPASRVKRNETDSSVGKTAVPTVEPPVTAQPNTPPAAAPSLQLPSIPSLNSRYKLVPGPNNTFQLIEESAQPAEPVKGNTEEVNTKSSRKRKSGEPSKSIESKNRKNGGESSNRNKESSPEVIDLEEPSPVIARPEKKSQEQQPYPVGLFSTLPHHSSIYPPAPTSEPTFTTPAMKKQSYTIVQTGNPSKLLISTKPQAPVEEPAKKRQKKSRHEVKEDKNDNKEPFNVTLEDAVPPKDAFFTFINVDPLLQPSYVLPTDNIIQESQISTSTPASKSNADKDKDKYSCNMCDEKFSREKKLLAHIHSHYNKMDEEDLLREKNNKKRGKK